MQEMSRTRTKMFISVLFAVLCSCDRSERRPEMGKDESATVEAVAPGEIGIPDEEALRSALAQYRKEKTQAARLSRQLSSSYQALREIFDEQERAGQPFRESLDVAFDSVSGRTFIGSVGIAQFAENLPDDQKFAAASVGMILSQFFESTPEELTSFLEGASKSEPSLIDALVYFGIKDASYDHGVLTRNDDERIESFRDWSFLAKSQNPVYRLLGAEVMLRLLRDPKDLTTFYLGFDIEDEPAIIDAVIRGLEKASTPAAKARLKEMFKSATAKGESELAGLAHKAASRIE